MNLHLWTYNRVDITPGASLCFCANCNPSPLEIRCGNSYFWVRGRVLQRAPSFLLKWKPRVLVTHSFWKHPYLGWISDFWCCFIPHVCWKKCLLYQQFSPWWNTHLYWFHFTPPARSGLKQPFFHSFSRWNHPKALRWPWQPDICATKSAFKEAFATSPSGNCVVCPWRMRVWWDTKWKTCSDKGNQQYPAISIYDKTKKLHQGLPKSDPMTFENAGLLPPPAQPPPPTTVADLHPLQPQ